LLLACASFGAAGAIFVATPNDLGGIVISALLGVIIGFVGFISFVIAAFFGQAANGINEIIRMAMRGVQANKVRAIFPVVGVTVSVSAVILLVSVGQGMKAGIAGQLGALGDDVLRIEPASKSRVENPPDPDNPMAAVSFVTSLAPAAKAGAMARSSIREGDIGRMREGRGADFIDKAAPMIQNTEFMTYGNKKTQSTVIGTTIDYQDVLNWRVETTGGSRWFSDGSKDEVVLGATAKDKLFGPGVPVSEVIGMSVTLEDADLKTRDYKVVGIMQPKDSGIASSTDNKVFFSLAAARDLYQGNSPPQPGSTQPGAKIDYGDRVDEINLKIKDVQKANQLSDAKSHAKATLERLRANDPEDTRYFLLRDKADISKPNEKIFQTMDGALYAIIFIALVEAGMGVLMIMYVSVKERTREIGVRKAMGATNGQVVGQFLFESILLCLIGAVIGVPLGLAMTFGLGWASKQFALGLSAPFQPLSIPLAVISIFIVGVVAGLFPSQQAARVAPVEAMR
jgi:putative ABC transport system permease protein